MKNEIIQWNELIEIPVAQPIISQKVIFILKNKSNNIIGSFIIHIDDILKKKYENLTCVNIYGSLKAVDNSKGGKIMNENPDLGSRWKGRVYLKIDYKDIDYPLAGVENIYGVFILNYILLNFSQQKKDYMISKSRFKKIKKISQKKKHKMEK